MTIARRINPIPPNIIYVVLLGISKPKILKVSLFSSVLSPVEIVNDQFFSTDPPLLSSNEMSTLCKPVDSCVDGKYITVYSVSDILLILISSVISELSNCRSSITYTICTCWGDINYLWLW